LVLSSVYNFYKLKKCTIFLSKAGRSPPPSTGWGEWGAAVVLIWKKEQWFSLPYIKLSGNGLTKCYCDVLQGQCYVLNYSGIHDIKNSTTLTEDLTDIILPRGAILFSADAKCMYTNIDTSTAVNTLCLFILANASHLPHNFPTALFLETLSTVMENNIFKFAGSHWLQLSGTTMGTPAACACATISYGQHENSKILPVYKSQLNAILTTYLVSGYHLR